MKSTKMTRLKFATLFLSLLLFACGGGESAEKEKSDTTQSKEKTDEVAEEKNSETEEKLCFASEGPLTYGYTNLIIKGNSVSGTMRLETPKAGMTLYSIDNIKGTKEGDKLSLTFTIADTDDGQRIGEPRKETWFLKGDELRSENEDEIAGVQKKIKCDENASFKAETPKPEALVSYQFDGVMDGKIKIKMFLTAKPNPEDKKENIYEGYYYYLSQGKDKKINLKGIGNPYGMIALQIDEVAGNKTFGKFMIEPGSDFESEFTCIWVSADGKKEMETILKPTK